ncbi:uncharacterized protein METZ01_LOCUS277137, partial [marine metagenome]
MDSWKLITIILFLLSGCDTYLKPPSFSPPMSIIEDIESEIIDAFTIRLLWNFDLNATEIDSFRIYHTSTDNSEQVQYVSFTSKFSIGIEQLSPDPDFLFDHYVDIKSLEYGKWHYFFISALHGEFESIDNSLTSGIKLQIVSPSISLEENPNACVSNNYDEDCKLIITNLDTSLVYFDSLIFIQNISSDSGVISIDTLSKSSDIDTTFLGLKICSDGDEELYIPDYCNFVPNTNYTIRHYFEQLSENGDEKRRSYNTDADSIINFNRFL